MLHSSAYDWLTKHSIDLEYKRYLFLAYLLKVEQLFMENKLYPVFEELKHNYQFLSTLKNQKEEVYQSFPRKLTKIDLKEYKLHYITPVKETELMAEIDRLIEETLPDLEHYLNEGDKIRSKVLENIEVTPVGVVPLHKREGYLFLSKQDHTRVYQYRLRTVEYPDPSENHKDIVTRFLRSYEPKTFSTFEKMKQQLMKERKQLPNPATFAIETHLEVPHIETLLPLAKQVIKSYAANEVKL